MIVATVRLYCVVNINELLSFYVTFDVPTHFQVRRMTKEEEAKNLNSNGEMRMVDEDGDGTVDEHLVLNKSESSVAGEVTVKPVTPKGR